MHFSKLLQGSKSAITMRAVSKESTCCYSFLYRTSLVGHNLIKSEFLPGALLEGGREGGLPCPFSKFKEKCHEFGKKCPNEVHIWVNFLL